MKIKKITPVCIHVPFEHGAKKSKISWSRLAKIRVCS